MKQQKDGRIEKLLKIIEDQKKEIRKLKKELKGHATAMSKSKDLLRGTAESIELEKLIRGANKGHSLKEIKEQEVCIKCHGTDVVVMGTIFGSLTSCSTCGFKNKVNNDDD